MNRGLVVAAQFALLTLVCAQADTAASNKEQEAPPELVVLREWGRRMQHQVDPIAMADVNQDGMDEILAGVKAQVFLLDGSTGNTIWESCSLPADVTAIAVGDSDNDGVDEIVCGTESGYLFVFGGDTFELERHASGFDGRVNSLLVDDVDGDGCAEIIVGTYLERVVWYGDYDHSVYYTGRIHVFNGLAAEPETTVTVGQVKSIGVRNVGNGAGDRRELVVGFQYSSWSYPGTFTTWHYWAGVKVLDTDYATVFQKRLFDYGGLADDFVFPAYFSSLCVGDCDDDGRDEFIVSCRAYKSHGEYSAPPGMKLCVFDPEAEEELCLVGDSTASPIPGLAIADLDRDGMEEILAASKDGFMYLLRGSTLHTLDTLAITTQLQPIDRFAFGNTDTDSPHEICVSNGDSLVVWEVEPLTRVETALPKPFTPPILLQNSPNPSEGRTVIKYGVPERTDVHLSIHNLLGQEIRVLVDEQQDAGLHTAIWSGRNDDGREVSAGAYFLRLEAGQHRTARKLVVVR